MAAVKRAVQVDIDQNKDLARRLNVGSIPDIRILSTREGQIGRMVGFGGMKLVDEIKAAKGRLASASKS